MALVTLRQLGIGFRGPPLLDEVDCQIERQQRIGLLGRNGAGKTTLLRMLCGDVEPDHGDVLLAAGARVSLLPQDVPGDLAGPAREIVAGGLTVGSDHDEPAWQGEQRVARILSRMELDGEARFETLSSGMKRRVLLARALVAEPDLLLLDEPTNHLDIDAIGWLEEFLLRWPTTLIFVTHDRMFLRRLATRILEIDRGRLFDWSCDYDTFLARKEAALAAEEKQHALFDKKLAQEEAWIRQGIKARRTRNEGRVRALEQMRRQRRDRRSKTGAANMSIEAGQRSGRLVAELRDVSFAYDGLEIVGDFSTTILRGDKVGVIGPNGVGKTTLLRIVLGELPPHEGTVRLGTNLHLAYFDQLRGQLVEEKSVQENVGEGGDRVEVGGRSRHILGYLQDFLFTPERARTPVRFLSGGERNRVLLARLFARPANVIVLDEPTNDLDAETLELLEEQLVQFAGTVLLVSHDREFLNHVVTSTIVFERGGVREYVGGYDDWLRQRPEPVIDAAPPEREKKSRRRRPEQSRPETTSAADQPSGSPQPRRLTYNEQRELAALPATIETLETEIGELHTFMASPDFYQQSRDEIAAAQARLNELEGRLATTYARWETLEG